MLSKREERRKYMLFTVTKYLDAMISKTPEILPLSPNIRATYNGEECGVGQNDVWLHAVRIPARQTFSDCENDEVIFTGKVTNDVMVFPSHMTDDKFYHSKWYLYMLRLRFDGDLITEIEELTCDQPTHCYNPINDAVVPQVIYDIPLPEEEQLTREEMVKMIDDYWLACAKEIPFSDVFCHPDGFRWEQGQLATDTARFPYSLSSEFKVPRFTWLMPENERRYPVVDVKRGTLVCIVVMGNAGPRRGAIVWEVFKFEHGLIKCMHGYYRVLVKHSGWAKDRPK
jgi:hypothetical protein